MMISKRMEQACQIARQMSAQFLVTAADTRSHVINVMIGLMSASIMRHVRIKSVGEAVSMT